ncbi:hypothetical protein [Archangium sp.]|uniref:hypothetical protein n=1 Tax=Archangium sp. TaxID=1872627 RepID=UPI002D52B4B0|nr:hypothetical protein [Archangium sp.]HYO53414.1 hypothetical protein [Archangium sp.]
MSEARPVWPESEGSGQGDRKLSEALLEFSSPLFASMPEARYMPEVVQDVLEFAADVWNVVVGSGPANLVQRLVQLIGYHSQRWNVPEAQMVERVLGLVGRKMRDFAQDHRMVFGVRAFWSDAGDEIRVRAVGAVLPLGTWIPVPLSVLPRSHWSDDPHPSPLPEGEGAYADPT